MNNLRVANESKQEEYIDKIVRRFNEEPGKGSLLLIGTSALFSPLISALLVSGLYIFNNEVGSKKEEVNSILGLWLTCTAVTWILGSVFSYQITNNVNMAINPNIYLWINLISAIGYVFFGIMLMNVFRFIKNKESVYPRLLVIPIKFTNLLDRLKKEII